MQGGWLANIVNTLTVRRNPSSGSYLMDGTSIPVYTQSRVYVWEFLRGYIDLTTMAAGDTIVVHKQIKNSPGGAFVESENYPKTYAGAQTDPLKLIESEVNIYGLQVTLQQTVLGTYRSIPVEFFDALMTGD